jgi:NAD-reducing hydrogenase large subunit
VDDNGAITWSNLIVATGPNNLAISRGVTQVAKRLVDGRRIQEGARDRVSALVRAYDPCLSCSTHAMGMVPVALQLEGPDGEPLDRVATPKPRARGWGPAPTCSRPVPPTRSAVHGRVR